MRNREQYQPLQPRTRVAAREAETRSGSQHHLQLMMMLRTVAEDIDVQYDEGQPS